MIVGCRSVRQGMRLKTFSSTGSHAFRIIRTKGTGEIRIDAAQTPGPTILLIEADQQPLLLLARIEVIGGAAEQRHAFSKGFDPIDRLGQEILMLHRNDREMHPHHLADLIAAIAAGIDHMFGMNVGPAR